MASTKRGPNKSLTKQQLIACEEYLVTGSYKLAAIKAGYSTPKCCWTVLHRPHCQEWLRLQEQIGDINEIDLVADNEALRGEPTRAWTLRRLVKLVLDTKTKPTDEVRALALIADIMALTKSAPPTVLQPVVIRDESGRDIYQFSQELATG